MHDLNALASEIHAANSHWWHNPATGERLVRNEGEMFMLMISELSEAMEGARKHLMDDKLPEREMLEVELADFIIRLLDWAGAHSVLIMDRNVLPPIDSSNIGEWLFRMTKFLGLMSNVPLDNKTELGFYVCAAVRRTEMFCDEFSLDLWAALKEKMAYNATRHDHTNEARLAPGGKKW